jgi:hypothetical protein
MTDRFDRLRVWPDPSLVEELRERLHAELERSPLDDTAAGHARLTIARPQAGDERAPMADMHLTQVGAQDHHQRNRWRSPGFAAAAVVVFGIGAIAVSISNTNTDDDVGVSEASTVAPGVAPTTTAAPRTVTALISVSASILEVTYTVPDGWTVQGWGGRVLGESSVVNIWDVGNVYADGCEWTLLDPRLGPTVDDLANVWAELPGFTATTPVAITVDGYPGKRVDYIVPDYATVLDPATGEDEADCAFGKFGLWTENPGIGTSPNFWAQVPGQQNRQWILDVDGTRLVINEWSEPGTTPEQLADMDQFLASIEIG